MNDVGFKGAADRLAHYSPAGHPLGRPRRPGETFARELGAGETAADALAAAGASEPLVAFFREAKPANLPAVIDRIAGSLGRADARSRALRDAAVYPLALAASVFLLMAVLFTFVRPRLDGAVAAAHGPAGASTLPLLPLLIAGGLTITLLLWLAAALYAAGPLAPFAAAKRRHQASVILAGAAAAVGAGVELDRALRASACLVEEGALSAATRELAAALTRGENSVPAASVLLGSVGGAVFVTAARQGAGASIIDALAALAEADAASTLPFDVMRAEVLSLFLAGIAVTAAGIAVMSCYTGVFSPS